MPSATERSLAVSPASSLGEHNLPPQMAVVLARGQSATVWPGCGA